MQNIILIGMPGCGKSTVGVVLAKVLGMSFMDSDLVIQQRQGKRLSEILDEMGDDGFRALENSVNASLEAEGCVIATGGSVVYGAEAMAHLRSIGTVIYLQLTYEHVEERLGDLHARGVTIKPGWTLRDLYNERTPLYERYAHLAIPCDGLRIREIIALIREQMGNA